MRKKIFRCIIQGCGFEADTLAEIEHHIEHVDEIHQVYLEKLGLTRCYQEEMRSEEELGEDAQTVLEVQTAKKERLPDWIEDAYNSKRSRPYPAYPYYLLTETKEFASIDEPFKTRNAKEFLAYLYEHHREDTMDWLKNHTKNLLVDKIRLGKNSTQLLTDECLERMTNDELRELFIREELKVERPESMAGLVSNRNMQLALFATGQLDACPLCNLSAVNLGANEQEAYREKLILDQLKPKMEKLTGKENYDQLTYRKYDGTWDGAEVKVCLRCSMHLHLRHPLVFKQLWKGNILGGQLADYLGSESYSQNKVTNLSKTNKSILEWLTNGSK